MPHYALKALVQGTVSLLPGSHRLNRLFQVHLTRSLAITETEFERKLAHARHHLEQLYAYGRAEDWQALELGTGWAPIVPIALALCGARRVWSLDRCTLYGEREIRRTLILFARQAADGCLAKHLPRLCEERLELLGAARRGGSSARVLGETLRVHLLTRDARATGLATGSIDLFTSNNTLEHIPGRTIQQILTEFRRIAAPGAVGSHFVDLSDHYARFDPKITPYNFLRFRPLIWRLFNNSLQFQNRLRPRDYVAIHVSAGWEVIAQQAVHGSLEELRATPVAEPFRSYP